MSLDVMLTLEDIVEQINKYEKQLADTENAVQQIKGAIASCKHQMTLLVSKQNEYVLKQAQGDKQDAIKEGQQPKDDSSEHQDRDSSREASETGGSDCSEQSRKDQQQEGELE
jgi:hypothetical protein